MWRSVLRYINVVALIILATEIYYRKKQRCRDADFEALVCLRADALDSVSRAGGGRWRRRAQPRTEAIGASHIGSGCDSRVKYIMAN